MSEYETFLNSLTDKQAIEFINNRHTPKGGAAVAAAVLKSIQYDGSRGLEHQGNWPANAGEFGVEAIYNDRGMGNRLSVQNYFFDSIEEVNAWVSEQTQVVVDGDWVVGCSAVVYQWDLGPSLITRHTF